MIANPSDDVLRSILLDARTIAVVGASQKPWRDSNSIMQFLIDAGYDVIPVNPAYDRVLGIVCYPSLGAVPRGVDIVDVFRNPAAVVPVVADAVAARARTVWMQLGVVNEEAAALAQRGGLTAVMDRCIAVEYGRLVGRERRRMG